MKPEQLEVVMALVEGKGRFCCSAYQYRYNLCNACLPVAFAKPLKNERGYSIVVVVSPLVAIMTR